MGYLCLWLAAGFCLSPHGAAAQRFSLSLDDIEIDEPDVPWDTVQTIDISRLELGPYYTVPNFLASDFTRANVLVEYALTGAYRATFRYPMIYRFEFGELRDGAFIVLQPRDLDTPGLEIHIELVDAIAERQRVESLRAAWSETVIASIQGQREDIGSGRRGRINVKLPIKLPSAVERIIGRGDQTNIDISGRESITFSGESRRVNPFIGVEGQQRQSLFPSLDMRQELDVRLQGQIGEKVNIQVDHSSAGLAENQNRIRLNYRGFEDDIVQLIELGNTSLSLPGSQLVSFSGSSQGLFGIKTLAQVGPMDITMIASKEEGETSSATFTPRGGTIGQTEERRILDIDYVKDTYFFFDPPPTDSTNFFFRPVEGAVEIFESVTDFERQANPELATFPGKAWVDSFGDGRNIRAARAALDAGQAPPPFEDRFFQLLQFGEDYRFVLDSVDESIIGVELLRAVPNSNVLAVRYVNEVGDTIGNFQSFTDTLDLELIKPFDARPTNQFGYTWSYMMRNIYNLGLSNIDGSTLDLEIVDNGLRLDPSIPEGAEVPWIRIFGLDRTDESGTGPPDSRIDLTTGLIDLQRGILTFPILTPFTPSDDSVAVWTDGKFAFPGSPYDEFRRPEIYTDFLTRPQDFQRFQIVVRAASTTRTFNIDALNITENSEIVRLDGRRLSRGRDYTIDYETGEVQLQGEILEDLTPSSNITIDYEFKPLVGGASSTLLGFSSLLTLSKKAKFGTTWLYESKTSATRRPRLGEEPTRTIVGDVNANISFNPPVLTDVVNLLPLVDTDARSSVVISGEIAASMPDPNTRGEVFIDDFEGVEDSDVFSLLRRSWNMASPPVDTTGFSTLDHTKRENVLWYNIEPEFGVTRRDLNPDLDERESTLVPSLDIEFDSVTVDTSRWAGVMSGFRGGGLDLSQGQFIELWVNDFKPDSTTRGGTLHIDLGLIDEDFYRPELNQFNNEDANRDGFTALTEDNGFDGIPNGEPGDDPGDDYDPKRIGGRFLMINGSEGNFLLDTEDLDGSGQLDQSNAYFSFDLDLRSTAIVDIRKDFPNFDRFNKQHHENDSWRLYRIPLADASEIVKDGRPSFAQIKHLRVWFDHVGDVVNPSVKRFQITGLKVVGNRWEKDGIRTDRDSLLTGLDTLGTTVTLGVISTKTDPVTYIPPIRPNERNDISEREQSLLLTYDNLQPSQSFRVRKRFAGRGLDWTNYRDISFFVHTDQLNASMEYYFWVAFDSLNFYEIAVPLTKTYFSSNNWSQVSVRLSEITSLKFEPVDSIVTGFVADLRDPSVKYKVRMVGTPNLFTVRFLYAGVRNSSGVASSGNLWLDDILLGNRKRDVDFAQRASASVSLGNVITLNGSWRRTGPDFRGLRQQRGSGRDARAYALSAKTNVRHFIPLFGFSIPVSGNFSQSTSLPKFTPNSDTEITDKQLQDSLKTSSSVRGFSVTVTHKASKNILVRNTLDKLRANFSLSESRLKSPSTADTSLSMAGTFDYQINFGNKPKIRLLRGTRFRYWINSFTLRINATRRTGQRWRNVGGAFSPDPKSFRAALSNSGAVTYIPFRSLTTSLRMTQQRDVRLPHKWLGIDIGTETRRGQNLQANYKPPPVWVLRSLQPDINYRAGYQEDSSPNVQRAGDPKGVRNASNRRDLSVKLSFQVGEYFRKILGGLKLAEDGGQSGAGGRGPGGATEAGAVADSTTTDKGPDPLVAIKKLGGILGNIRKVSTSIRHQVRSSYSRIPERPSLAYQLGFTDDSGVLLSDGTPVDPQRVARSLSVTMDSGTQITRNIDVAARFTESSTRTTFRANETTTSNRTWPDLNVSWKGLETFGPFRGLFSTTSATLNFRKTRNETGRGDETETSRESRQVTPAIAFAWKNGVSGSFNMSFVKNTADTRGALNETSSKNFTIDLKYSFAPGKALKIPLPFLKNKKLKSRLDTSLNIAYSKNSGRRSTLGSELFEPLPGANTLRVSPRLTYNFSQTLNGSFFVDFRRLFSEATNQTTTTVLVGLTAIFTF